MTRLQKVLVSAFGALALAALCMIWDSAARPNQTKPQETKYPEVHHQLGGDYTMSSIMVPPGDWWCSTSSFSVFLRLGVKNGQAAVHARGETSICTAIVRVLLEPDLTLDDRFELELTRDQWVATLTGRLPEVEDGIELRPEEDVIDRLLIEYVRGGLSSDRTFEMRLLRRHPPPKGVRPLIEKLRRQIASKE